MSKKVRVPKNFKTWSTVQTKNYISSHNCSALSDIDAVQQITGFLYFILGNHCSNNDVILTVSEI